MNPSNDSLSVDHLQLGQRAFNSCRAANCSTLAQVRTGIFGLLSSDRVGRKTAQEICSALRSLDEATDASGMIDWERFWEARPIVAFRIAITTSNLDRVCAEVRNAPLGVLHLKKSCSGLGANGINTVGMLLDAAKSGIGKLENFGAAAHQEVVEALPALSKSVLADGIVDWCRYAAERRFPLIPDNADGQLSGETLLHLIPTICESIIPTQMDNRAWQIFQRRLLLPEAQRETLENIGLVFGITRERVRQVESMCIQAIRKPLFQENYFGLRFRLSPQLRQIFATALKHFESLGQPAWLESRWAEEIATVWEVSPPSVARFDRLLIELFGYRKLRLERSELEPLIVCETTPDPESKRLAGLVENIHDILNENTLGLDSFQLAIALKKKKTSFGGLDELPALVELTSSVETIEEDLYRLRFEKLRGRVEQVVRILSDNGAPMHHSELVRAINRLVQPTRRIESKANLINQISGDLRIQPIGKSGRWTLAEWGLETRPLVEVIAEVLVEADEAMHSSEIASRVLEKRPGSRASVGMLLEAHPDRFRRVGPKTYAMASWDISSDEDKWWHSDAVGRFVVEFFAQRSGEAVDFRELRESFSKKSGLSPRSAQGVLAFHPAVEVDRPDSRRRMARLRKDWQNFKRKRRTSPDRPLQIDAINDLALTKLLAAPTHELQLVELVRAISSETGIQRPNIYAALSQNSEIETLPVERTALKICRLLGRSDPTFPQVEELRNVQWRQECERAVARLTLDDVDLGLSILGRQFDQAMRQMLETARDHARKPVTNDNLKTINARIQWAVQHKVFCDEPTLNLLRIERNAIAHEPTPLEERRAILKFAPFLAGLYIDYLILIDQKISGFIKPSSEPSLA